MLKLKFEKRGNIVCHIITVLALMVASISVIATTTANRVVAASTTVPVNMIYYGWHDSTVDTKIINAHPEFLVDNSPAGPWRGNASISKFTSAGINYFEYIDGGYEGTISRFIPNDLQSNLNYINAAAASGAYGVFVDEVSSNPSNASLNYLKQLADRAHSLGLKIVFNSGVNYWSDSLMIYCDFINSSEIWNNQSLTTSQTKWASRTWLLTQNVTDATTAAYLTNASLSKGIRAHYACSSYGALPTWLETYIVQISFPTTTAEPKLATVAVSASNITNTNATVTGSLTDKGSAASVSVSFEYGTTTSYGSTAAGVPATLTSAGAFTANLIGLTPSQTYHFRTKAVGDGTSYSNDATFTTKSSIPPTSVTEAVSAVTATSATLNGILTSLGTATPVNISFEYGTTTSYGSTAAGVPTTLTSAGAFTANLTGLTPGQTYHFRTKAVGDGTSYSSDATFTTKSVATEPTLVNLTTNTSGSEVWLDYAYKGVTPMNLTVSKGYHHIGFFQFGYNNNIALESNFLMEDTGLTIKGDLLSSQITYTDNDPADTTNKLWNTIGIVANTPKPSGGLNEYNLYLSITSTTVSGIKVGQQVWCAASIADFPKLLIPGATLTGYLDRSIGWWVFSSTTS